MTIKKNAFTQYGGIIMYPEKNSKEVSISEY